MKPLQGRQLGVARQQLRALVYSGEGTAIERVELGLVWFVNGDGVAYPTLETLRQQIAESGHPLHRSTITAVIPRLPHFLTVGYFARKGLDARTGALRGTAVRIVRPDLAEALGFPPLSEAVERLQMSRWMLLTDLAEEALETSSEEISQTRFSPPKTPTPRRPRKNATQGTPSFEPGDVTKLKRESVSRARRRRDVASEGDE